MTAHLYISRYHQGWVAEKNNGILCVKIKTLRMVVSYGTHVDILHDRWLSKAFSSKQIAHLSTQKYFQPEITLPPKQFQLLLLADTHTKSFEACFTRYTISNSRPKQVILGQIESEKSELHDDSVKVTGFVCVTLSEIKCIFLHDFI